MAINFNDTTPAAPVGGVNLKWQSDGSGNASAYASLFSPVRTVTANDTASISDRLVLCDATSGSLTETLPALSSVQTMVIVVKKKDSSANTVTVSGNGATIDGASTIVLYVQNASVVLQWNGASWSIEAFNPGSVQLVGGVTHPVRTVTAAAVTATINDYLILCNTTSNAITVTLPAGLSSVQTMVLVVKKTDATANLVTISPGAASIDGFPSFALYTQYSSITLQWNGGYWSIEAFDPGRWADWTPTYTGSGSMTVGSIATAQATYVRNLRSVSFSINTTLTLGGTANAQLNISYPIASTFAAGMSTSAYGLPSTGLWQPLISSLQAGPTFALYGPGLNNWPLGSTIFSASGTYAV